MRTIWPLIFSIFLLSLKVSLDVLGGIYSNVLFPGDIIYSVLAYDIWAITEELAGSPVIRVQEHSGRAWLVAFVMIHMLTYVGYLILLRDHRQTLESGYLLAGLIAGFVTYASGPILITFKLQLPS